MATKMAPSPPFAWLAARRPAELPEETLEPPVKPPPGEKSDCVQKEIMCRMRLYAESDCVESDCVQSQIVCRVRLGAERDWVQSEIVCRVKSCRGHDRGTCRNRRTIDPDQDGRSSLRVEDLLWDHDVEEQAVLCSVARLSLDGHLKGRGVGGVEVELAHLAGEVVGDESCGPSVRLRRRAGGTSGARGGRTGRDAFPVGHGLRADARHGAVVDGGVYAGGGEREGEAKVADGCLGEADVGEVVVVAGDLRCKARC